jgi:hypothetical protein
VQSALELLLKALLQSPELLWKVQSALELL